MADSVLASCPPIWDQLTSSGIDSAYLEAGCEREASFTKFLEKTGGQRDVSELNSSFDHEPHKVPNGAVAMEKVQATVEKTYRQVVEETATSKASHAAFLEKAQALPVQGAIQALDAAIAQAGEALSEANTKVQQAHGCETADAILARFDPDLNTQGMEDDVKSTKLDEVRAELFKKRAEVSLLCAKSSLKAILGPESELKEGEPVVGELGSGDSTADSSEGPQTPSEVASSSREAVEMNVVYKLILELNSLCNGNGIYRNLAEFAAQQHSVAEQMLAEYRVSSEELSARIQKQDTIVTSMSKKRICCEGEMRDLLEKLKTAYDTWSIRYEAELLEEEKLERLKDQKALMVEELSQMTQSFNEVTAETEKVTTSCTTCQTEVAESHAATTQAVVELHQTSLVKLTETVGMGFSLNERGDRVFSSLAEKAKAEADEWETKIMTAENPLSSVCAVWRGRSEKCQEKARGLWETMQGNAATQRAQEDLIENIKLAAQAHPEVLEIVTKAFEDSKQGVASYFANEETQTTLAKRGSGEDQLEKARREWETKRAQEINDMNEAHRATIQAKDAEMQEYQAKMEAKMKAQMEAQMEALMDARMADMERLLERRMMGLSQNRKA